MDILKALQGEESRLVKKAQIIRAAIDMLGGNSSEVEGNGRRKKRHWHMSAAAKARISKAQKARWAAKRKAG
jgi:hypothetical protein